jgi:hypothetical protein
LPLAHSLRTGLVDDFFPAAADALRPAAVGQTLALKLTTGGVPPPSCGHDITFCAGPCSHGGTGVIATEGASTTW